MSRSLPVHDGIARSTDALAIPIARCRELLGDDARDLSDAEVDEIRQHAATFARILIQMFRDARREHDGHQI